MFLHAQNTKTDNLLAASQCRSHFYLPRNIYLFEGLGSLYPNPDRIDWRKLVKKLVFDGITGSIWSCFTNISIGSQPILAPTKIWRPTFCHTRSCWNILRTSWSIFWTIFAKSNRSIGFYLAFLRNNLLQPEKYSPRHFKKVVYFNISPEALQ